jgi:hypothetical protein
MPCSAVHIYPNFRQTCYLHVLGGESGTDIVRGNTRTKAPRNQIEGRRIMNEYGAHIRFMFLSALIRGHKISLQTYIENVQMYFH